MRNALVGAALCAWAVSAPAQEGIARAENIAWSELESFGVSVSTERFSDLMRVSVSVSRQFPCGLRAVSVATFDGAYPILAATLAPDNGKYQFQLLAKYAAHTRVDFSCAQRSPSGAAMYILELSGLPPDA